MMLTITAVPSLAVPQHRHHPTQTQVDMPDTTAQEAIEAVSDTSDVDSMATVPEPVYHQNDEFSSDERLILDILESRPVRNFGGIALVAGIILLFFLFLVLPVIALILFLRYLVKRHNDNVRLREKAIEQGIYTSTEIPRQDTYRPQTVHEVSDRNQWNKGVRNVAIGVGLIIMFLFWGARVLAGIGALVACYGAGQMYIAWDSHSSNGAGKANASEKAEDDKQKPEN